MTGRTDLIAATLSEAVTGLARQLDAAGIEGALGDARLLAVHALGIDRTGLHTGRDRRLSPAESKVLERLGRRRAAGEPVSRIVGQREFWSLPFALSPATLDPRPDSETVIEAALERFPDRDQPLSILDLGTGSGCLLVALLTELSHAWGVGIDASPGAAAMARRNAEALGVGGRSSFLAGDWGRALDGGFDLVVSNPPYIVEAEIDALAPDVALFDPRSALSGGADGLDAYRILAPALPGLLNPGGWTVLEVGDGQATPVMSCLADAGLVSLDAVEDLAGVRRCVRGKK